MRLIAATLLALLALPAVAQETRPAPTQPGDTQPTTAPLVRITPATTQPTTAPSSTQPSATRPATTAPVAVRPAAVSSPETAPIPAPPPEGRPLAGPEEGYPLLMLDLPSQTVDAWYERGDAQAQAEQLEAYLRALIWGLDGEAAALAEGRLIDVDPTGYVLMRETPENVEQIQRTVDPGLQSALRRRTLEGTSGTQIASGIMSAPPEAGAEMLRRAARRPEPVELEGGYATGRGGSVARMTLRQDNDRQWRDLRITLLDVFLEADNDRLVAVFTVDTPTLFDEIEIQENRSETIEGYRIRFIEGQTSPEIEATIEITDLVAR